MANGDVLAVRIASATNHNGWVAEIDLDNLAVGGTYAFGLGANNDPAAAKIVFTVTSQGYDATGTATTRQRTVYGTQWVRKVYPNHAQADESTAATTLTVRVALSDVIYDPDTAITVTIAAGFYTQGTASNATTAMAVTNNSTQIYPKTIGRWAWPVPFSRVTGNFALEAVVFNRFARQGQPVACVTFTVTDESANAVNVTATAMTVSTANGANDQGAVLVYAATINVATLTQGQVLTCRFVASPWVGDSGSVLDSNTGIAQPDERLANLALFCDKSATYEHAFAVVASTGQASGATTWVYDTQAAAEAAYVSANTNAYSGIAYALQAIKAHNNANHSHNDPGGGVVLLAQASHSYTSAGRVDSGAMKTWVTITRLSTAAKASTVIADGGGSYWQTERLRLFDVTLASASSGVINGDGTTTEAVWIDGTAINYTSGGAINGFQVAFATNNLVTRLNGGFSTALSTRNPFALIRGNVNTSTTMLDLVVDFYCVLGNKNIRLRDWETGDTGGGQPSDNAIAAFNKVFNLTTGWGYTSIVSATTRTHGIAIVQNVVEQATTPAGALLAIAADGSTAGSNPVNNVLLLYNVFVGERCNLAYNDFILNGGAPAYRWNWLIAYNLFDDYNCVTDVDGHGGSPGAARTGNHALVHGVGLRGNAFWDRGAAAASYEPRFDGIPAYRATPATPLYVDDASIEGDGSGNGDYHLQVGSPAYTLALDALLPYDLDGTARQLTGGSSGAYEMVAGAPPTGIALVGSVVAAQADDNPQTPSLDTTGANLLIAVVVDHSSGGGGVPDDNKSNNSWVELAIPTPANSSRTRIFYHTNTPTVGVNHQFMFTGTGVYATVIFAAFSGAHQTAPFLTGKQNGFAIGAGQTVQPGAVTSDAEGWLFVSGLGLDVADNGISMSGGWEDPVGSETNGTQRGGYLSWTVWPSAATLNPTWTSVDANAMSAVMAAFRPGADEGEPPPATLVFPRWASVRR